MNTIRIQKKILTLSCAVLLALPLSAAGPSFMSIYAEDEVAVEDASTAESSLSTVQDDSAQSDGSLFEDPEGIANEQIYEVNHETDMLVRVH